MFLVYKYKVKLTKITRWNPLLENYFELDKKEDKDKVINKEEEKVDEVDGPEENIQQNERKAEEERVKNLLELCNIQGAVFQKLKEYKDLIILKFATDFSGKILLNYFYF